MKVLTLDIYYTIIQIKIYKLELKTESIFTIKLDTLQGLKYLIIKSRKRHFLKIGKLAEFLTVLSNSLKSLKQWYRERSNFVTS